MQRRKRKNILPYIYTATKSLDTEYIFNGNEKEDAAVTIKGSDMHARLRAAYDDLLEIRASSGYTKDISNKNIATASLTLLFTDSDTDQGALGDDIETYQIALINTHLFNEKKNKELTENELYKISNSKRLVSCLDTYLTHYSLRSLSGNNNKRNKDFNSMLKERIRSFSEYSHLYNEGPGNYIKDEDEMLKHIESGIFHQNMHHSEQAIMHYLSSWLGTHMLTTILHKKGAAYLYGIVLDIYTQHMICCNCNVCLLGMQHSYEDGFLYRLSQDLEGNRIESRTNHLMLHSRVSASFPCKGQTLEALRLNDDKKVVHEYNPDTRNEIFQAENRALGTRKIINREHYDITDYHGNFFVSSEFDSIKLKRKIKRW